MQTQEATPTPRSVVQIPTNQATLLAFEIRMPITAEDFREMAGVLSQAYDDEGQIDLLVRIVGNLRFKFELLREGLIGVKREALKHVDRYAVVGGPGWLGTAVEVLDPLFRVKVRHYESDDEEDAWQWLLNDKTEEDNE